MPDKARSINVALIKAEWHGEVVIQAIKGFSQAWKESGLLMDTVHQHSVPGAFEIPLLAKTLALTRKYDAIVACALVVDGGIYRHDFVAATVIQGLMGGQLETMTPVFSVVLTPHHFQPSQEHADFFTEHFFGKGREACDACVRTVRTYRQLLPGHAAQAVSGLLASSGQREAAACTTLPM